MFKVICLCLCIVAINLTDVSALSDEEKDIFREAMAPVLAECSTEHGVSSVEIEAAKASNTADAIKPCFLGCVMKRIEILDSKGLYAPEKGLAKLKNLVKNEEDIAKFEDISKKCMKVNDESVSDGEAGCERAKLIITCALENKAEMPY